MVVAYLGGFQLDTDNIEGLKLIALRALQAEQLHWSSYI